MKTSKNVLREEMVEIVAEEILNHYGVTMSRGTVEVAKGGYRVDLKSFYRSKMEANISRYYTYLKIPFFYEGKEFEFKKIKRGNRYYRPDFYLPVTDEWVEAKGYFRNSCKVKIRRFKKFYPEEYRKLRFIIPDKYAKDKSNGAIMEFLLDELKIKFEDIQSYKEMENIGKVIIPNWE